MHPFHDINTPWQVGETCNANRQSARFFSFPTGRGKISARAYLFTAPPPALVGTNRGF